MFLRVTFIATEELYEFKEQKKRARKCSCFQVSRGKKLDTVSQRREQREKDPPILHYRSTTRLLPLPISLSHFPIPVSRLTVSVGYGNLALIVIGLPIKTVFNPPPP